MINVKICDAIMGTGKSQSAITYMNEHPNERFIYITPYLDEAKRIKLACPRLGFVEPSSKLPKYHFHKFEHSAALIAEGRNIATTHQAFKNYTPDVLENIRELGYTLIIDEDVDVLENFQFRSDDLQIAVDAGYIKLEGDDYVAVCDKYKTGALSDLFRLFKSRRLIRMPGEQSKKERFLYWLLSPELITSFKRVFVLTYLFEAQSLHHLMEMYHISYEYIGVARDPETETGYRFTSYPGYVPEYVSNLKNMIHILDSSKLNSVGDERFALSMTRVKNDDNETERVRKNIYNCFNNIWRGIPKSERMCGTYKSGFGRLKGKGYTNSMLPFNLKATNDYRDKTHLVYAANIFMNVTDKSFYQQNGINVDEDMYALSIMVQWIWRSAIRDGKEIYLYIPSKRMRNILVNWINSFSTDSINEGGDAIERLEQQQKVS